MPPTNNPNLAETDNGPAFLLHKEGYSIEDYRLIKQIGEGSFGEVWLADRAGFNVALKILKTSVNSEETKRELESLDKLKKLHHKFLLHTQNFWSDRDRLYIEMELADGGSLKERLKAYQALGKVAVPEDELLKYFTEIGKALDYLHSHRPVYLHRDIKPANILIVQGCAKLADFGLLRQVTGDNTSTKTQGGTFPYMAPESIKEDKFSILTDLFAFAVSYAELRQGSLPFIGNNQFQICQKILEEPPKLTDVFDPEERKVLLKALGKNPADRFSSCGEFVFELNRVVPWLPAVTIATLPVRPEPAISANHKSTDAKPPRTTEQGTSRKNSPSTMPASDLPPEVAPGASTVFNKDGGTVRSETNRQGAKSTGETTAKKPGFDHGETSIPSPAPIEKKKAAYQAAPMPAPAPVPAGPKSPKRLLFAAVLGVVLVSGISGIWYIASQGALGAVRDRIEKKNYAEAAQKVTDTSGLFLPSRNELQKEIEEKWWAQVNQPLLEDHPALEKRKKEVQEFAIHFPAHSAAKSLRSKIEEKLDPTPPEGGKLSDADTALFVDLLAQAKKKIDRENFVSARNDLFEASKLIKANKLPKDASEQQQAKSYFRELRGQLIKYVAVERPNPKNAAGVLERLKQFEKFRNDKELDWAEDDLFRCDSDKSLALVYLQDYSGAFKIYVDLQKKDAKARLGDHTALFLALLPDQGDIKTQALNLGADGGLPKELQLLNRLAVAYGMQKDQQAAASLVGFLEDNGVSAIVRKDLWRALARLEKEMENIPFEVLAALEKALPTSSDDPIKIANSQILAGVLKRQIKTGNYQLLADQDQRANGLIWINRIEVPDPYLLALKAECLVESGSNPQDLIPLFSLKADWYGSYVHALVLEKNAQVTLAADTLMDALKVKRDILNPRQRTERAVGILRHAVRTLQQKTGKDSKEFANEKDAADAIHWLTLVFDLLEPSPDDKSIDDFAALAFAGVKARDGKILEKARVSLEKIGSVKGFYYLAKAYVAEGKSEDKVFIYYEKAVYAQPAGQDALRKKAAEEGTLLLASDDAAKGLWKEAGRHSVLGQAFAFKVRKWELETAAKLNAKAVEIEVRAKVNQVLGERKVIDETCRVYEEAIRRACDGDPNKPPDGFHVPVVVANLNVMAKWTYPPPIKVFKEQMTPAVAEGKTAVVWAQKLGWEELQLQGILRSADIRYALFKKLDRERLERKEKANYAVIRTECQEIREQYENARGMKKAKELYKELFVGELSYKIGKLYWHTCDFPDEDNDKTIGRAEAKVASRELSACKRALQMAPQKLTDYEAFLLKDIQLDLDDENFKALLKP